MTSTAIYTGLQNYELNAILFPQPETSVNGQEPRAVVEVVDTVLSNYGNSRKSETIEVDLREHGLHIQGSITLRGNSSGSITLNGDDGGILDFAIGAHTYNFMQIRDLQRDEKIQEYVHLDADISHPFSIEIGNDTAILSVGGKSIPIERPLRDIVTGLTMNGIDVQWSLHIEQDGKTLEDVKQSLIVEREATERAILTLASFDQALHAYDYETEPLGSTDAEAVATIASALSLQRIALYAGCNTRYWARG